MLEKITHYDAQLLIYLNNLGSESQDMFWLLVTRIIFWIPLYFFFSYLVYKKFNKKEALRILYTFLAMLFVTFNLTEYVKEYVVRQRPINNEQIFHSLRVMIQPLDYSFFSGHACNSFAITTLFYLFIRKRIKFPAVFFMWPIVFTYSRIYLGVHYPTDVFVGMCVGVTLAVFFYWLHKILSLRIDKKNEIISE